MKERPGKEEERSKDCMRYEKSSKEKAILIAFHG